MVKTAVTWTEAKTRCANMGARLAQPVNEEENEHIKSELLDIDFQVWFGLEKVNNVWQYTDGSVPGFTDWGPGKKHTFHDGGGGSMVMPPLTMQSNQIWVPFSKNVFFFFFFNTNGSICAYKVFAFKFLSFKDN